ncbi:hypothetical protein [Demequina flava]|uniref:hypothetical protein n=1 Tax=Demequina flava TaxID=1095025 RepID=UPI0007850D07|nr:hypothetical protein [Demequina flava]
MDRTPQETDTDDTTVVGDPGAPEESITDTADETPSETAAPPAEVETALDEPDSTDDEAVSTDDVSASADTATAEQRIVGTVPATGPIPIVGDAIPVTGPVPVIRPIYPPKRRLPWIISTIALLLLLIGGAYLGWRMYEVNTEWQAYAGDLEMANYELGEQIAQEQATVVEKEAEVDLLSEQLANSNDRLLDLADEKASAVDGQEFNEQLIEGLNTTLSLGQTATASLNSCIDGLEQLNEYLAAPEDEYDPEQVEDYADGVNELCAASDTATANFQSALASE